jgi:glutathione-regulated potassium-efflux system ancillary protein KefG
MAKILILFAHPLFEKSRIHAHLLQAAKTVSDVTIHDLYQIYPDFDIDVDREKNLLLTHEIIIWQHPLYWYSGPALLKQWLDLVLEHGWAYGKCGNFLARKKVFNVISSGGSLQAYQPGGYNQYTIREFLRPFEQTATLCGMIYWPPFWISGVHTMQQDKKNQYAEDYKLLLTSLNNNFFSEEEILQAALFNNILSISSAII